MPEPPPPPVVPGRGVRWGLGDVVGGFLLAQVASVLGALIILSATGYTTEEEIDVAPVWVLFLLQVPLWVGYLGWTWWASRTKGHGIVADFGLRSTWSDAGVGLAAGIATQLVVVPLLYVPILWIWKGQDVSEVARDLTDRATTPADVVVLLLILVVGAPLIEELFFRGLLLRSLENRLGTVWAVVLSSAVFGAIHFQRLQFPALFVFGLVAAVLTVRTGRLGAAIWAHVGFNGVTAIVLLLL